MVPVGFCPGKTCRSEKILQLCPRAQNNPTRGLASTARFKGHYFSFRCCSRGRQRRPEEGGGETWSTPSFARALLWLPACDFLLSHSSSPAAGARLLYFARSLLQGRRLFSLTQSARLQMRLWHSELPAVEHLQKTLLCSVCWIKLWFFKQATIRAIIFSPICALIQDSFTQAKP